MPARPAETNEPMGKHRKPPSFPPPADAEPPSVSPAGVVTVVLAAGIGASAVGVERDASDAPFQFFFWIVLSVGDDGVADGGELDTDLIL